MTVRIPLLLAVSLLLLSGGLVMAQQAPPSPPAPAPPAVAVAPRPPEVPPDVFVYFDSGNFLGIFPEEVTRENMNRYTLREPRGVGITKVIEGSPAERAGLKKNDVILRFDGEATNSVRKLNRLISEAAPEQTARLTISRGGVEQEVSVRLGRRDHLPRALNEIMPPQGDEMRQPGDVKQRLLDGMGRNKGNFSFVFGANRRIGVRTTQLTEQLADYFGVTAGRGLLITSVNENSPAAKAGLRAGDVITEADGSRVEAAGDLMRAINRKDEGEITLTIIRNKSQRTIRLTPERGQAIPFDFSPEIEIAPQIGHIVLPRLEFQIPKIELPAIPRIEIRAMPKLENLVLPRIQIRPL